MNTKSFFPWVALGLAGLLPAAASSHREAPLITTTPKLDCADFYAFGSYEPGREGYVTLVADYLPLQDAYGGPNYFQLDPHGLYEIHVDNNGDAIEDLTFQFRFSNVSRDIALVIGTGDNKRTNAIPLLAAGQITAGNNAALNVDQTYTLTVVKGPRRTGTATPILNPVDQSPNFTKPQDNVGNKTFPEYDAYANQYVYEIALPGTDKKGKVFVGQRKDPFVVNLGETFDLINLNPLGPVDGAKDTLADKNVTALCLELPKEYLLAGGSGSIIGAWTTASTVKNLGNVGEEITQVSRLGMPLVNEVVIGLKDKDTFNASEPKNDGQFVDYITHPTLPALIELLFSVPAPTLFPRTDLVAVFATGVDGLNKNGSVAEMQRLNTAIPATARDQQNNLGVIAGITKGVLDPAKADLAGFPNGRRPGDDVVDIALRVVMGKLLTPDVAPIDDAPLTDGALVNASFFSNKFPYLTTPLAGSPNDLSITILPQAAPSLQAPFKNVPGTYDASTHRLTVSAPAEGSSLLGVQANGKVSLADPAVANGKLSAIVK